MTLLEIALDYHKAGCVVTPTDGNGKPKVAPWSHYKDNIQVTEEVRKDFSNYGAEGIAILCGENNIEALDLDAKNWMQEEEMHSLFERYANQLAIQRGLNEITKWGMHEETTKSQGYHYIYRFIGDNKSEALAKGDNGGVLIEILGKGHTCTVAPTPKYEDINHQLCNLPLLTAEQRQVLVDTAKLFNSYDPPKQEEWQSKEKTVQYTPPTGNNPFRKSAWVDYNERVTEGDIIGMLELNDWKVKSISSRQIRLTRPGAKNATGVDAFFDRDKRVLFVKSSSSDMHRQNSSGEDVPWMPHQIFTFFNYGGDYSAAARALYEQGYGDKIESTRHTHHNKVAPLRDAYISSYNTSFDYEEEMLEINPKDQKKEELRGKLSELLWDPTKPLINPDPVLTYKGAFYDEEKRMASAGSIIGIAGQEKAGKTALARALIASHLSETYRPLGLKLFFPTGVVCYFNTEEEEYYFRMGNEKTQALAGFDPVERLHNFEPYNLTSIGDPDYKMDLIRERVATGDVSCVFIDQAGDLMLDTNDKRETTKIKDFLFEIKESGITIVLLLHLNPGSLKEQGALGTELRRKASCVLQTTMVEEGVFNLHLKFQRGAKKPFTDIQFGRDANSYLYEFGAPSAPTYNLDF